MDGMSDTGTWKPVDLAIQGSPSLEGRVLEDQRTILAIARTEDNPHSMKEACNELQRKGRHYGYHVQADSVINSAWQTYIITQTKKAEKFAEAGNLPKALEHFGNVEALPGLKIKDEYWENRAKIIGVGVITTPAEVCLDEALEYAKLGRIQGASSLCSAARDCEAAKSETYEISEGTFLRVDGKEVSMGVRLYDSAGDTIYGPGKKQPERTTEINQKLRYTMKIAYQHSIENKLAEAIGCAVTPGLYPEAYITPKLEDIKIIMDHRIKNTTNPGEQAMELASLAWYTETILEPFFDMLLDCNNDRDHPLKDLYETKRDEGRNIIGASAITKDREQYLALTDPDGLIEQTLKAATGDYMRIPSPNDCAIA